MSLKAKIAAASKKANEFKKKETKKDPPNKTPFQSYMTTKGATAADTSATNVSQARKLTENKPLLNKAYELTYGQDYKDNNQYTVRGVPKPLSTLRGDHSGYSNMNNPQRTIFEQEVAKMRQAQAANSKKNK